MGAAVSAEKVRRPLHRPALRLHQFEYERFLQNKTRVIPGMLKKKNNQLNFKSIPQIMVVKTTSQ